MELLFINQKEILFGKHNINTNVNKEILMKMIKRKPAAKRVDFSVMYNR